MGKLCAGWGFRGVGVLLLLCGFSCQLCLQHLSKIFALWSSRYLLPLSSCHLGTLSPQIFLEESYQCLIYLFFIMYALGFLITEEGESLYFRHCFDYLNGKSKSTQLVGITLEG
jgi:hypothetical protein